jgi:AAA15 family ATPase/GTPase
MIKSFSIENYRSINQKVTLHFAKSGKKKSELPHYHRVGNTELALTSAIYGANASGKSNLLRAMADLKQLVLRSDRNEPLASIPEYRPFRLQRGNENKPVQLQLEWYIHAIPYAYTLHFSQQQIEWEKLVFSPFGKEALLFERHADKEMLFGDYFKGEKRIIERMLLPNQLFLSKGAKNNSETCLTVYNNLKENLRISQHSDNRSQKGNVFALELAKNPDSAFANKLSALVAALDTGIAKLTAIENPRNEWVHRSPSGGIRPPYEIKTQHSLYDENSQPIGSEEFDLNDESSGTNSLLFLGGVILNVLENGSTLIIDEFETNLHPFLTAYLIKLFHNPVSNPKNAQLVFTTHDTTLLNGDLFNRDQIWFTEKNELGATELTRCSDIEGLRLGTPLEKWYLSGLLGGTAIIDDSNLFIEFQKEKGDA